LRQFANELGLVGLVHLGGIIYDGNWGSDCCWKIALVADKRSAATDTDSDQIYGTLAKHEYEGLLVLMASVATS